MKRLLLFSLALTVFCSFSFKTTNPKKSIIQRIEQNLLSGWVVQRVDADRERFSETMTTLGVQYGLTLINEDLPVVLRTQEGVQKVFPEFKILVCESDKRADMMGYVKERSENGNFKHCFIDTREYLLVCIWSECRIEYQNEVGKTAYAEYGGSKDYQRVRSKLIKNLQWYFEQY